MNVRGAVLGGITGGVAMTLLGVLVRAGGVEMNAEKMLGTMFTAGGAAWIIGFAVIHIMLAGFAMALIPAVHRMIPEQMMAPGAFMAGMGATGVGLFVLEHLIYGGIVGAMYGPVQWPVGSTYAGGAQISTR